MEKNYLLRNEERVCIFFDGSNFYRGLRRFVGRTPFPPAAIVRLSRRLAGIRSLVRISYYNSTLRRDDPGYSAQQRFFSGLMRSDLVGLKLGRLAKRGFEVSCPGCGWRAGRVICEKCRSPFNLARYQDKGTDVNIATDLLVSCFKNDYDTAILISEDGDFAGAVDEIRKSGKRVENGYFRKRYLSQRCDSFIRLDKQMILEIR